MTLNQNLSESTRGLLDLARAEAERLKHDFVGSEHILLALTGNPSERLTLLLSRSEVDGPALRSQVEATVKPGESEIPAADLSIRSGAKKVLDLATVEARNLGHPSTEPEHVWLALLRERRGSLQQILSAAGANLDRARAEFTRILPGEKKSVTPVPSAPAAPKEKPSLEKAAVEKPATESTRRPRPERTKSAPTSVPAAAQPERTTERAPEPERPRLPPRAAILAHRNPIITWRNVLLLAVPASIVLKVMHAPPLAIFIVACIAVLPLAGYMGEATEHLSHRTGPGLGGLLNATFGNAAELIIAIAALRAGLIDLVKASITGSILGNLLLILGLSLLAASKGRPVIRFNRTAAGMSSAMLALAVVGLVFPAIFHHLHPSENIQELRLSEGVAIILGLTYVCSLVFALKTHNDLFCGEEHDFPGRPWSVGGSVTVLAIATVGVAIESEFLVHSVEAVTATLGLSQTFLGLIIIPFIGNAAEHATAVVVARKGKMDLALNIALGSSTQVALLVAPLLVLAGVLMGQAMNLVFQPFEIAALAMATIVTAIITLDGESHWFEGVQLLAVYAMVAVAAFFM
ncbi:MAG: calcium/proton exchanger [Gemmatimonadota bacterium]